MYRWFGLMLSPEVVSKRGNESFDRSLNLLLTIFAIVLLIPLTGCKTEQQTEGTESNSGPHHRVAVANYPLYCMVSKICESSATVKEVVYVGPPSGTDPHSWVPTADQIRDLQKVDLIVCNGPGAVFATWIDKVTIDESKLCNTTDAIKQTEFVLVKDYQLVHSHGPEGEHSHTWVVPQSWLSPRIARKQAKFCYQRLTKLYGQSPELDNGFAELQKNFDSLEALHEKIRNQAPKLVVASSTPDVQYLTRSFDWEDRYLQWTDSRDVAQAREELKQMHERILKADATAAPNETLFLWSGRQIDELAGFVDSQWPRSAKLDLVDSPQGKSLDPEDYFQRMTQNLRLLESALE